MTRVTSAWLLRADPWTQMSAPGCSETQLFCTAKVDWNSGVVRGVIGHSGVACLFRGALLSILHLHGHITLLQQQDIQFLLLLLMLLILLLLLLLLIVGVAVTLICNCLM